MTLLRLVLTAVGLGLPLLLEAAPASDDSIRELLRVMRLEASLERSLGQVEEMEKQMVELLTKEVPEASVSAVSEKARARFAAIIRAEISWAALEPVYVEAFREVYTEEEVAALTTFYRSPVGQTLVTKMPLVLQKAMTSVQSRLGPLMNKLAKATEVLEAEVRKEREGELKPARRSRK